MWAPTLRRGGRPGIGSEPPPPGSLPEIPRPLLSSSEQLALCIHQKGFSGSFHVWAQAAWSPSLGSLWPWSRGQPGSLTWPACPIIPSAVRGMGRKQALDLALLQSVSAQKFGCKKRHPLNPAEARSRCMRSPVWNQDADFCHCGPDAPPISVPQWVCLSAAHPAANEPRPRCGGTGCKMTAITARIYRSPSMRPALGETRYTLGDSH